MDLTMLPDAKLRQRSTDVHLPLGDEDLAIIAQMIAYIDASQIPGATIRPGVGIAAVQMGFLKRMFYVHLASDGNEPAFRELLINPKIIKRKGRAALENGEGCLSVDENWPNIQGLVHRAAEIHVEGYSFFHQAHVKYKLQGYLAIVFQHECDHLDGKLFFDHIDMQKPYDHLVREEII